MSKQAATATATATAAVRSAADDATLAKQAQPLVNELRLAVKANDKAGRRIVNACLAFRKLETDEKHVKGFITEAYTAAGYDEKSKTLANMRSAALALFRAPTVPATLPNSLQLAAKQVRQLEDYQAMSASSGRQGAKAGTRAPRAPRAPRGPVGEPTKATDNAKAPSDDVAPVGVDTIKAELLAHVNKLKARAGDDAAASLLAELVDVLS